MALIPKNLKTKLIFASLCKVETYPFEINLSIQIVSFYRSHMFYYLFCHIFHPLFIRVQTLSFTPLSQHKYIIYLTAWIKEQLDEWKNVAGLRSWLALKIGHLTSSRIWAPSCLKIGVLGDFLFCIFYVYDLIFVPTPDIFWFLTSCPYSSVLVFYLVKTAQKQNLGHADILGCVFSAGLYVSWR